MVVSIGPDLNIVFVNRTALDVLGMKEADVLGKKCYEVFVSETGDKPDSVLEAALRTGEMSKGEVSIKVRGTEALSHHCHGAQGRVRQGGRRRRIL